MDFGNWCLKALDNSLITLRSNLKEFIGNFRREALRKIRGSSITKVQYEKSLKEMEEDLLNNYKDISHRNAILLAREIKNEFKNRSNELRDTIKALEQSGSETKVKLETTIATLKAKEIETEKLKSNLLSIQASSKDIPKLRKNVEELSGKLQAIDRANIQLNALLQKRDSRIKEMQIIIQRKDVDWQKKFSAEQNYWKMKLAEVSVKTEVENKPLEHS